MFLHPMQFSVWENLFCGPRASLISPVFFASLFGAAMLTGDAPECEKTGAWNSFRNIHIRSVQTKALPVPATKLGTFLVLSSWWCYFSCGLQPVRRRVFRFRVRIRRHWVYQAKIETLRLCSTGRFCVSRSKSDQ